jgi:hypothetical protein
MGAQRSLARACSDGLLQTVAQQSSGALLRSTKGSNLLGQRLNDSVDPPDSAFLVGAMSKHSIHACLPLASIAHTLFQQLSKALTNTVQHDGGCRLHMASTVPVQHTQHSCIVPAAIPACWHTPVGTRSSKHKTKSRKATNTRCQAAAARCWARKTEVHPHAKCRCTYSTSQPQAIRSSHATEDPKQAH